ncbi:hypothetical protein NL676_030440 [Syzygium grande]|nr:hypothetical protein NL676_030440 [Syzygium grande]
MFDQPHGLPQVSKQKAVRSSVQTLLSQKSLDLPWLQPQKPQHLPCTREQGGDNNGENNGLSQWRHFSITRLHHDCTCHLAVRVSGDA